MDESHLRDIRPEDKQALVRFHERLSPESRYRRYHAAKNELTAGDLRYLTEVDGHRHVAVVAEGADGEFAGVARSVAIDEAGRSAELAIVVRDDIQAAGVGAQLVAELQRRAAREGFGHLVAEVQADNHRALRFFQGLGARQRGSVSGGVCSLVLPVR
jgi:GNAT superfamily N-acetyltransferase